MVVSHRQIREIADEIWNLNDPVVDIETFCAKKLKEWNPGMSNLEITDNIDTVLKPLKHQLNNKIISFKTKGIPPNFDFDRYSTDTLVRSSSNNDNADWVNYVRKFRNDIKLAIKFVDPISFEHFCKHILQINRITKSFVTRPSKEGGVDFYGLLEMCNYTNDVFLNSVKLRIIGQAKHHSGDQKVGEAGIDEIRTKYSDFQTLRGTAIKVLPNWFTQTSFPIVCMVVTNTDFTKGARRSAARDNIILRDGDQITEDIINSPKAEEWFELDKHGNKRFSRELFFKSFVEQD